MGTVRERAEDEAINVFARNLHDLLMAAPAGLRATMGLDCILDFTNSYSGILAP